MLQAAQGQGFMRGQRSSFYSLFTGVNKNGRLKLGRWIDVLIFNVLVTAHFSMCNLEVQVRELRSLN